MKVPGDSARVLTTEDVKGIVFAWRGAEGEVVSALAWEAWLAARDLEAFDRGYAQGAEYGAIIRQVWPTH